MGHEIIIRAGFAAALAAGFSLALASQAPAQKAAPKPAAAKPAAAPKVDPAAVKALGDMSRFLQSLSTFRLTSEATLDLVTNDGQRIQSDGVATYRVRKPNAFVIDLKGDWNRQYVYDGKTFTLYAPERGYFASWPAPATIQATIADAETRFGISLPLDDLFRWSGPDGARAETLTSGFLVGADAVGGVKTNHYAFRESNNIDWQVWIQQGDQPLPLKLVIVDRRDPAAPAYVARLTWTLNPPLTDADFTFQPRPDAKRIRVILQQ